MRRGCQPGRPRHLSSSLQGEVARHRGSLANRPGDGVLRRSGQYRLRKSFEVSVVSETHLSAIVMGDGPPGEWARQICVHTVIPPSRSFDRPPRAKCAKYLSDSEM